MGLFPQFIGGNGRGKRRVIIIQDEVACPKFLTRLEVLCTRHPIPVRMKYIGQSTSQSGSPMAVYACVCAGCGWREGWVQERTTGRPFRLWAGVRRKQ